MPDCPVRVDWEVATDPDLRRVVRRGDATARPEAGHSVHIELHGLLPNREYWYRFRAGEHVSPTGRTKTLPHPGERPSALTFAVASCQHFQTGYYTAYRSLAAGNPDFVLFLGDYIYEYGPRDGWPRVHAGPAEPVDLDGYRLRWSQYKSDPDLRAAHVAAPFITIWDDHEVKNDYAGLLPQPSSVPGFAARRAAAYQAFYENLPIRRRGDFTDLRIYHRFQAGDLATFSLLDTRQYRDDQPCDDGTQFGNLHVDESCTQRHDLDRSILGRRQREWLLDGLARSRTRWNLVGQQLLCAELDVDPDPGRGLWEVDGWDGYTADRARLLECVAGASVRNPVVLSGDIHSHLIADLKPDFRDERSPVVATELVTAGISSPSFEDLSLYRPDNPHVRYTSRRNGYLWLRLSRDALEVEARTMLNPDGSKYVLPDSQCVTDAVYVVEDGLGGARPATT